MIRILSLLVAAVLVTAGCSSAPQRLGAGFGTPSAVVAYRGVTSRRPELQTYLAVSSRRGSELRILDPREDRPVLGPTLVFPLSVPTDPRPLRLAAASLGDVDAAGSPLADLLVVASPGAAEGPSLEIVNTWEPNTRIAQQLPTAGIPAGAELLSLAAAPVVGQPGRAIVVAGLATSAGGVLAVYEVQRGEGGAVGFAGTAPVVRPLVGGAGAFDPLDLAFSPGGDLLFVATTDLLGGTARLPVRGVAQLAVTSADPTAWTFTALDARDGTNLVATASLVERVLADPSNPNVFEGAEELRVYANLDPAGCGETAPIRCGVATLAPNVGLVPDPVVAAGSGGDVAQPYRAPLETNGLVTSIATSGAPAAAPQDWQCPGLAGPLAKVQLAPPGPGISCTTALGVATSTDGNVYVMDLGRFQIPSLTSTLQSATGTRVTSATSVAPAGAVGTSLTLLDPSGQLVTEVANLASNIQVTPGFTPDDTFDVTWQGVLPGLFAVRGVVVRTGPSSWAIAAQQDSGSRTGTAADWIVATRVAAPALGVAAQDLVELSPVADVQSATKLCPVDASGIPVAQETPVVRVIPPTENPALLPGGGLEIADGCWSAGLAEKERRGVTFNVRASGLVLSSTLLGYLGRPQLHVPSSGAAPVRHAVQYSAAADAPTPEAALAAEPVSEAQALARKARRRFYPADYSCSDAVGGCERYGIPYPFAPGPVVAFTVATNGTPPRGATIVFSTASGYSPFVTRPSGAVLPISVARVDRSVIPGGEKLGYRWYVAYSDDQVFVFGAAEAPNQASSIR